MDEPGTLPLLRMFLVAVGEQWLALVVGGLLIGAMQLWERFSGFNIPNRWYGVVALVCLLYACFLAWKEAAARRALHVADDRHDDHADRRVGLPRARRRIPIQTTITALLIGCAVIVTRVFAAQWWELRGL